MAIVDFGRAFELLKWLDAFLSQPASKYVELKPQNLPESGGVYAVGLDHGGTSKIVYVGLTGNLRNRAYKIHLHGDKAGGQVKNALIHFGYAKTMPEAKAFMLSHCTLRFVEVPDHREREMREGFAKAILQPEFSLYKSKEH